MSAVIALMTERHHMTRCQAMRTIQSVVRSEVLELVPSKGGIVLRLSDTAKQRFNCGDNHRSCEPKIGGESR